MECIIFEFLKLEFWKVCFIEITGGFCPTLYAANSIQIKGIANIL